MLNIGEVSIIELILTIFIISYTVYNFVYSKIVESRETNGFYFRKNIENSIKIRNEISSIFHSCNADSVNLLHAHNHDILRPEQPWYISLLYFYPEDPKNLIKVLWTEIEIDTQYKKILKQLLKHKLIMIETEDLPESCKLKNNYETLGIKSSLVLSLITSKKNFIYISINFKEKIKQHEELIKILMTARSSIIQYLD